MGKLIQFPIARIQRRRHAVAHVFDAFGDLETLERSQMKLVAGSFGIALLATLLLQVTLG